MLADLNYAWRQLTKSPGFALTAVLTLALGIGATTAIFSLLDQALLRTLPVRDPQQLVILEATPANVWNGDTDTEGGGTAAYFSYPMYKWLRDQNQVFSGLIATYQAQAGAVWHNQSQLVATELVSGNYFNVLGVRPAIGRLLTPSDDVARNGSPVVVLSFNYWRTHLAEDPQVLGQTLDINGHPFQIIGVSAPGFQNTNWGNAADVFVPITMKPTITPEWDELDAHNGRWMNILGRLKPGESLAQAQAGLAPLWHSLRQAEVPLMGDTSPDFVKQFVTESRLHLIEGSRGFSWSRDDVQKPLLITMVLASLVLLMAAVNVASLVLVRAAGREREICMRYALGAGRNRVVRQLFSEGLLLGLLGGAAGLALAPATIRLLVSRLHVGGGESAYSTHLNGALLVFGFVLAIVVSLLFTVAPVFQLWKLNLVGTLKQQGAGSMGGRLGFRRAVVGLQIGLSLLLLISAGLFVRTLQNLHDVKVGFATEHLITFGVDPRLAGYDAGAVPALVRQITERLSAIPGVESAAATSDAELAGNGSAGGIRVAGVPEDTNNHIHSERAMITPGYFATLKVPLLAGREFTPQDSASGQQVAVINQAFADQVFGTPQKAVGHTLIRGHGAEAVQMQIVGVVRDYVHRDVWSKIVISTYSPVAQQTVVPEMYYYVRTWGAPSAAMNMVRQTMQSIDPKLVLDGLTTMDGEISRDLNDQRMVALLAVSFGVLAMLLAAIGLYGVLAYATAQRTREIGVRMALGADRSRVVALVLRDVMRLAGISVAIALPVALLATRALKSQLFGVSNMSAFVYVPMTLLVLLVALAAAALPARRAAQVEPMEALRDS